VYAATEELEGSVLGSHSGRQSQSAPSAAWRVASYFVSFRIEFFFRVVQSAACTLSTFSETSVSIPEGER